MGTTADKLNKILETKEAIRTAINNKGGTLTTTDTFSSYATAIDNLPSGGNDWLKEYLDETKDASFLFCGMSGTSNQTTWGSNLTYERLKKILSYDTTSSVENMKGMFYYCVQLTETTLINTSLVYDMRFMFQNCRILTKIDITNMGDSNMNFANGCYSLTKLIIRNMPTIPSLNSNAFNGCYHFDGTTNATYNPQGLKDGRIYVPDDKVDALKTASGWSTYADIIVPLSTLVE